MEISRNGTLHSHRGPAEFFTGQVRVDPLFSAHDPARGSASYVTFEPGARSAWHAHPLDQPLVVTAGSGCVQAWGRPVQEIGPCDVIGTPAGEKHGHGAKATTSLTHIEIREALSGKVVDWMEEVRDDRYPNF